MKVSEMIAALVEEIVKRGDCELVIPGEDYNTWRSIVSIEVRKTPATADAGSGYLHINRPK